MPALRYPRYGRYPRWSGTATDAWEFRIADAIARELNAGSHGWSGFFSSESVTAAVNELKIYAAPDLKLLKVDVAPAKIPVSHWIARPEAKREYEYETQIDLQRMVKPDDLTTLRSLSRISERIHDWFLKPHDLDGIPGWVTFAAMREDVYDAQLLYGNRTWETLIVVTTRGYRT